MHVSPPQLCHSTNNSISDNILICQCNFNCLSCSFMNIIWKSYIQVQETISYDVNVILGLDYYFYEYYSNMLYTRTWDSMLWMVAFWSEDQIPSCNFIFPTGQWIQVYTHVVSWHYMLQQLVPLISVTSVFYMSHFDTDFKVHFNKVYDEA